MKYGLTLHYYFWPHITHIPLEFAQCPFLRCVNQCQFSMCKFNCFVLLQILFISHFVRGGIFWTLYCSTLGIGEYRSRHFYLPIHPSGFNCHRLSKAFSNRCWPNTFGARYSWHYLETVDRVGKLVLMSGTLNKSLSSSIQWCNHSMSILKVTHCRWPLNVSIWQFWVTPTKANLEPGLCTLYAWIYNCITSANHRSISMASTSHTRL